MAVLQFLKVYDRAEVKQDSYGFLLSVFFLNCCCCLVAKLYPTLLWPSIPPGFSVHGILQTSILQWVAISFSRGSSQPRDQTCISCIGKRILYHWAMGEAQYLESYNVIPWFPPSIYTFPSHYLLRKLTNTHKPSASILRLFRLFKAASPQIKTPYFS